MRNIKGKDRSLWQLFANICYYLGYYQRGYRWKKKQIQDLINDLADSFSDYYRDMHQPEDVEDYGYYFLGSIVVSKRKGKRYLIDGQQRLTSLLLLLMHLNFLQKGNGESIVDDIKSMIRRNDIGKRVYSVNVPSRAACMDALFEGKEYSVDDASESIVNLVKRHENIKEFLEEFLLQKLIHEDTGSTEKFLQIFILWLIHKVKLIEITAESRHDAYTIFEAMNDRGLPLSPTEMLKGYLLDNIKDVDHRNEADKRIKGHLDSFKKYSPDTASDFFKIWLRSQYAETIRDKKRGSKPKDYDLIGTEYHRWVRETLGKIGLKKGGNDFYRFVAQDLGYFAERYLRLLVAADRRAQKLESVRYNSDAGFTLQYPLILAAVAPGDREELATEKIKLVADFLDCWLNFRSWHSKSISYSTMYNRIFDLIREIRSKSLDDIRDILYKRLVQEMGKTGFTEPVRRNRFTSKTVHRQLARLIDWLEEQLTGHSGHYEDYIVRSGKGAYQIEHIWADKYDRFAKEFDQERDFDSHRELIGGLLLLPQSINASLQDMDYPGKLDVYREQNPLAQSLHPNFYEHNPSMRRVMEKYDLPFRAHESFEKADLDERSVLYCKMAELIWSPDRLRS